MSQDLKSLLAELKANELMMQTRVELIMKENDDLHQRLNDMLEHAHALERELRSWEEEGPAPSLAAAAQIYQSRISRLEDELRELREAGGMR